MELERLSQEFSICKLDDLSDIGCTEGTFFLGRTEDEISLVCEMAHAPANAREREDGWRGFRVRGSLDFSLVGILSEISTALADAGIGIFAVSTYDTDYIFVKTGSFDGARDALEAAGHAVF